MQENEKRKRQAEYMRAYRRKHPQYSKDQWTQSAVRLLRRKGYVVVAPDDEDKMRDLMQKMFPYDGNDQNAIGSQILAEAIFRAQTAQEQAAEIEAAAEARGLKVVGMAELLPEKEGGAE